MTPRRQSECILASESLSAARSSAASWGREGSEGLGNSHSSIGAEPFQVTPARSKWQLWYYLRRGACAVLAYPTPLLLYYYNF
ncbi:hypothetical protein EVAR_2607_1 [Eumeta japonica]|uniref:Uncharacterized protein n=1 Tax=Eumeta variegata TaxID=151549 RepID=A0A4C1SQ23_EUMVA|nr:hypothetical protein EVAR_2607_1 [Eumeta japonica]